MRINDSQIIWGGKQRRKPEGIMIPTHLKVLTIEEKPFVYVRRMGDDEFRCEPDERPCPLFNASDATGKCHHNPLHSTPLAEPSVSLAANEFCCRGYCIDLLIELSKRINFTYDLALSPDGQFGHYILRNNTGAMTLRKEWTGLIGELVNERAE